MLIFCKRACTGGFFKYNKSYIPINLCWSYKFNTLCYLQATFYVIRSICEYYITVKCGNCKNISVCFIRTSTVEIVYPRLYFALAKPSLFNAISSIYKPYLCRIVRISSVSKKKKTGRGGYRLPKSFAGIIMLHAAEQQQRNEAINQSANRFGVAKHRWAKTFRLRNNIHHCSGGLLILSPKVCLLPTKIYT